MNIYKTIQGDTWDLIAYKLFGNEKYMENLIIANWEFLDVLVFSSGTTLIVPDLPEEMDKDLHFGDKRARKSLQVMRMVMMNE